MRALFATLILSLVSLTLLRGQTDPGAAQDAEAERQKILKAADQLDQLQSNSESTRAEVDGFKQQLTTLQQQNATLQQQNNDLQQQILALKSAFALAEAARVKEQKILIDNVAHMIAAGSGTKPKKKTASTNAAESSPTATTTAPAPETMPPPTAGDDTTSGPPPEQKGYYHMVGAGETLTMIASAYRAQGVKVTVEEIQKANNLTDTSVLQIGQKLFVPKPEK